MIAAMAEGAGLLLSGMVIGRLWPGRRRRPRPGGPVCGCRHHASFHDARGRCWQAACPCQQYTGPEPMPEYYAPEITR